MKKRGEEGGINGEKRRKMRKKAEKEKKKREKVTCNALKWVALHLGKKLFLTRGKNDHFALYYIPLRETEIDMPKRKKNSNER